MTLPHALRLVTAALAIAVAAATAKEKPMANDPFAGKRAMFRAQVGAGRFPSESPGKGILATWPPCLELLGVADAGWEVRSELTFPTGPGRATRSCVLALEGDMVQFQLHLSTVGPTAARQQLEDWAVVGDSAQVAYRTGPTDLGSLSASAAGGPFVSYLWVFHDAAISLERTAGAVDVLPMARTVQKFLERHLVDAAKRSPPRVRRASVDPASVRVGESATLEADLGPGAAGTIVRAIASGDGVRLEQQGDTTWRVVATQPGSAELDVCAVDPATLLSGSARATVTVLP